MEHMRAVEQAVQRLGFAKGQTPLYSFFGSAMGRQRLPRFLPATGAYTGKSSLLQSTGTANAERSFQNRKQIGKNCCVRCELDRFWLGLPGTRLLVTKLYSLTRLETDRRNCWCLP